MGTHRRSEAGPRGISRGVVIGVASVVVLVLLVVGWMRLRDVSTEQGVEAAAQCVEGETTLQVAADPTIADTARQVAEQYNATDPVVRDRCVHVEVEAASAADATTRISEGDSVPGLWIAPNSTAAARVADRTSSTPRSLVASPVVLATSGEGADELRAANPTWGALPGLLSGSDAPAPLLPNDPITDAAATAMVSDWLGLGSAAPSEEDVTSAGGRRVLANIGAASLRTDGAGSGEDPGAPADVIGALDAVAGSSDRVAFATEQQVSQRSDLQAIAPAGGAPVADYPAVVPETTGEDDALVAIAGEFLTYARGDGMQTFTDAGFVPVDRITAPRPADSPQVADPVAAALAQPFGISTTTVLLDVSPAAAAIEGGSTIRAAAGAALADVIDRLPDAASVGFSTFGVTSATPSAYDVDIPTDVLSDPGTDGSASHRDQLTTALRSWVPTAVSDAGGSDTADAYDSLVTGYRTAVTDWSEGVPNRVVVISVGANDGSPSATSAASQLGAAVDSDRPVQVDAILIGSDPDSDDWTRLTDLTEGRTEQVGSSAGFELANLLSSSF